MRILTEKINLDLNQNGIQATIDLREGDIESRLIIATLRGYGDAFRPDDNVIAVIRAKKPDGTIIYNNCLVEDGKVKFLVTSQYAAVVGNYNACIELIKDGVVLYSPKFSFHVAANELSDSEVESSSEYTELTTALEQALTALELAQNLHLLKFVENLEDEGDEKYLYVLTSDYHYIPYVWDAENERYMQLESNLEELAEFAYLLNIQKERVDNLLAEAVPGSTTRDLEVIDGRTGYDGRTYANLGTAIREQVYDLHSENTNLQNSMEAADTNLNNIKANKSDVNTTTANIEAEIAVERARIDNIAHLAEGSTTGDAELADIRVGADGKTYSSAGDAVRGQVTDLKDALNNFKFSSTSFNIAQNASHNYNTDVCPISAVSGENIFVEIKTADANSISCQIFARKTDNTFAKLKNATTDGDAYIFTLSYDISGIGIYIGTQSSPKSINVLVNKEDSFLFMPDELTEIDKIARYGSCDFNPLLFKVGTLYSGIYNAYTTNRIATAPSFLKFDYPVTVSVDSGWRFGVHTFSAASESAFVSDSGWQTSNYTIPKNTYFRLVVGKVTEVSETANVNEWLSHISYNTEISERISVLESEFSTATYSYDGEIIDFRKHGFEATKIGTVMAIPSGATYQQGFAIYNNVICQLYSDNKIILANYPSRSVIATLDITSGHGDTMDFSNEFYDSDDEFPLAYITADTNPATVYVVRITRSAITLIRTLYFDDITKTGYYAGHCIDANTNILYMVGYLQNSYTEATDNKMIVSSWDLNNLTDNEDDTYTPEYIESFNVPFMKTVQGQKFFDNKLWLLSSPSGTFNTVIYVVDPFKKKIVTTMSNFPTALKDTECEDISFVLENNKYHMVISCYYYYRLDFN